MNKPNVLFILTDDQRYDTIAALGCDEIKTPNLDKLVKSGTAFTQAHIPGGTSGAVCMPSRAMINSGKTLFHLYCEGGQIPEKDVTMCQCFRENGYHTVGVGKWHNGIESYVRSFEDGENIFFGGMWDHWNVPVCAFHKDGVYERTSKFTADFFHANHPMEMICDKITTGVHSTDLFTESALKFLRQPQEKPFFLYLSYLAPHDPRTMPKEFQDMYKPEDITLPESFMQMHPFAYGVGDRVGEMRDEDLAALPRNENEIKQHICDYYAMISHIDYNIGKLIKCLEETGQLENTIIVFTGDNGLAVGRHGLMGKQNLYDHSVRIPLIISGRGIAENATRDDFVYLLDLFPTLCDAAGIQIPTSVEGKSFFSALKGEKCNNREDLYFAYTNLVRAVKDRDFKLIEYRKARGSSQLFDLKNDPNELHNLFNDKKYGEEIQKLRKRMKQYKEEWEDDPQNIYTSAFWGEVTL